MQRNGFKERGTAKTSDAEGTRFVIVPQIGMNGMPQVRMGVVGYAMQLVGNHMHFHAIQVHIIVKFHSASPHAIT